MKKITYLILILSVISQLSYAQRWKRTRYELFGSIGPTLFYGELGGSNKPGTHFLGDIDLKGTRYNLAFGIRYKVKEKFALKVNFIYGRLNGSDAYTEYEPRRNRNASFYSGFFEPSIQGEYSILKERLGARYTFQNLRRFKLMYINTYVFIGIGGIYFNPHTTNKDFPTNKNEHFSKFNAVIPIGIGFRYGFNRRTTIGIEFGQRYTTTDYLDGFSDVHSKARDSYATISIIFTYKLKTARSGLPKF
ncbi:MAG: hypothetical protein Fur0028_15440 [Bacteroidales bacterium]